MPSTAARRLLQDLKSIKRDILTLISTAPVDENIFVWNAVIIGPARTPYEYGIFKLTLEFSDKYPNEPPIVKFIDEMFHPNIQSDGRVLHDILRHKWNPSYSVTDLLMAIQSWLYEPDVYSFGLNPYATQVYMINEKEFNRRVKLTVEKSWGSTNSS
ncbi:hypothetical protein HZS_7841 [Henneguya salminicola]|uniref:Ubiquitin-conjugating enzyme E2 2 (Trinotate prediction) n=1 Tax=Henneguya salminicola TaxID=69463 RepID=A0A6G3MKY7_HENSL|nr:hypothetical protein HZS_7841 [Henneguya salminicola]